MAIPIFLESALSISLLPVAVAAEEGQDKEAAEAERAATVLLFWARIVVAVHLRKIN
jgi:hypothetical protein